MTKSRTKNAFHKAILTAKSNCVARAIAAVVTNCVAIALTMTLVAGPVFAQIGTPPNVSPTDKMVRWTYKDDTSSDFNHILSVIQAKTGWAFTAKDFILFEERDLANSHYTYFLQAAGGIPVKNHSLRIWTAGKDNHSVQVEALLEAPPALNEKTQLILSQSFQILSVTPERNRMQLLEVARARVRANPDDRVITSMSSTDFWLGKSFVREYKIKGRRGYHTIAVNQITKRVESYSYREFPQQDSPIKNAYMDLPALVYPIYEQPEGPESQTILPREIVVLQNIKTDTSVVTQDPFLPLKSRRYPEDKHDPVVGLTPEGKKLGFWSMPEVKREAANIVASLPRRENSFQAGLVLEGKYATVSLHPDAIQKFKGLNFQPRLSAQFKPLFKPTPENANTFEMVPSASYLGRPIMSEDEALARPARRLADHDPASYINDGFDEIQVYYAINRMFESLHSGGFSDPELSTRPFNAFLYDPDISYQDNAYYTDDTINFTTYSPKAQNFARDNSTIWHELGHGVMDRLMGDWITLADTGGLSEGMADFVADLVIADVTNNTPFPGSEYFRIKNKTAFNVTNEVHDDGESYGGSMHDILMEAMKQMGRPGLFKMIDLTMETMRLTRNNPALTANDWFNHMLFADEMGHETVRAPGELSGIIRSSLAGRNFSLTGETPAYFKIEYAGYDVAGNAKGTRERPIPVVLKAADTSTYPLKISIKNSAFYQFKFPVTVQVEYKTGPLQGGIHWLGKYATAPQTVTLNSESDIADLTLAINGICDRVNREDGTCVDYAYLKVFNAGETDYPRAKKRFYLRLKPEANAL